MKHITIEAFTPELFNKGLIRVTAQTDRGYGFGEGFSNRFVAKNGITLASNVRPARDKDHDNTIWLRGSDTTKDNVSIAIPVKRLAKVLEAVKEYNLYFSDAEITRRRLAAEAARRAEAARYAYVAPASCVNGCTITVG